MTYIIRKFFIIKEKKCLLRQIPTSLATNSYLTYVKFLPYLFMSFDKYDININIKLL